MKRSQERITKSDLKKLLRLSLEDIGSFFARYPKYSKAYRGKQVLIALGQGAALHYIDKKNGVKDFDVWFFFPRKSIQLPYRRRGVVDFGPSKFGKIMGQEGFKGRSIDVLMRSDSHFNRGSAEECIKKYLNDKSTTTAKMLSKKAMVGLYPENLLGKVLWP
jgi:hypothetical protein